MAITNSTFAQLDETAAPSNPGASIARVYADSTSHTVKLAINSSGFSDILTSSIAPQTVDASLASTSNGVINTNTGAGADIALTLPALVVGQRYSFAVTVAHYIRINNFDNSTTINLGTTASAAGGFVRSNVLGAMLEIIAVSSTKWFARVTGDWTVDS